MYMMVLENIEEQRCVCVCVYAGFSPRFQFVQQEKPGYKMGYKRVGVKKMITWVDLVSF